MQESLIYYTGQSGGKELILKSLTNKRRICSRGVNTNLGCECSRGWTLI